MKKITTVYNPDSINHKKSARISLISLISWLTVLVVIVMFWAGVAVVYKKDYVPHAIAKLEHREKKFLATHKTLHRKLTGNRSDV